MGLPPVAVGVLVWLSSIVRSDDLVGLLHENESATENLRVRQL